MLDLLRGDVDDTTPPVFDPLTLSPITTNCVLSVPIANPGLVSATDTCDPDVMVSVTTTQSIGSICQTGQVLHIYTALFATIQTWVMELEFPQSSTAV